MSKPDEHLLQPSVHSKASLKLQIIHCKLVRGSRCDSAPAVADFQTDTDCGGSWHARDGLMKMMTMMMTMMMMATMTKVMTKMMKTPVTIQRCGGAVNQHYDRKQGIAPLSF